MESEEYIKLDNQPAFSKNIIIILLSIALLGTIIYLFYEKSQHKKELRVGENSIDELERSREILKQELRLTRADYDISKSLVKVKDIKLKEKDQLIFDKQKKIQELLNQDVISNNDLNTARKLIGSLKSDLGEYKKEIEILQIKNTRLANHNSILANENKTVIQQNKQIKNDLNKEIVERENDKKEYISTLSISNYTISGLKHNILGKETETERAKRIDLLRISFDVDPNPAAASENKELFIAIYLPDGSLGKFDDAISGNINLKNGKTIAYSDRINFKYDANKLNPISFDWKGYNFKKGEYKIDIYNNGLKVAQRILVLK